MTGGVNETGSFSVTEAANAIVIGCPDQLDIAVAEELHELLKVISVGEVKNIEFDVANVERADTAALQLLTSFVRDAKSQSYSISWNRPSEPLCKAAELLGLQDYLEL